MSLPLNAIDRLFDRLLATYGRDFSARWEGLDQGAVKSSWAHELTGYEKNLKAIGWALENLPERAPNVIEFRNLCRRAPSLEPLRLESPKVDPVIAAQVLGGLRQSAPQPANRLDWARAIVADVAAGMKRSPAVLKMAKDALGVAA
ncbi:hypothetical protein MCEMIEM13_01509 [Comamonadaceae bacterium]